MRIWSIHPKYLDTKSLVALWRETLLAKNVLQGKTKGYKNHPQLERFKALDTPVDAINAYLQAVWEEADNRGYKFNKSKFEKPIKDIKIEVTMGQIYFEKQHLLSKLKLRDTARYTQLKDKKKLETHPIFNLIEGEVEKWEKIHSEKVPIPKKKKTI